MMVVMEVDAPELSGGLRYRKDQAKKLGGAGNVEYLGVAIPVSNQDLASVSASVP
jgi:hypothetical protein